MKNKLFTKIVRSLIVLNLFSCSSTSKQGADGTLENSELTASEARMNNNWNNIPQQNSKQKQVANESKQSENTDQSNNMNNESAELTSDSNNYSSNNIQLENNNENSYSAGQNEEVIEEEYAGNAVNTEQVNVVDTTYEQGVVNQQVEVDNMSNNSYIYEQDKALQNEDVMPLLSYLWWIGFDYQIKQNKIQIQLLTKGKPKYQVYTETNKKGQYELIIKFLNTKLKKKVRRSLDASEFYSPVAYIRMRDNQVNTTVDVVMTLRKLAKPSVYAKEGNVLVEFEIYKDPTAPSSDFKQVKAQVINSKNNLIPFYQKNTDQPYSQLAKSNNKKVYPNEFKTFDSNSAKVESEDLTEEYIPQEEQVVETPEYENLTSADTLPVENLQQEQVNSSNTYENVQNNKEVTTSNSLFENNVNSEGADTNNYANDFPQSNNVATNTTSVDQYSNGGEYAPTENTQPNYESDEMLDEGDLNEDESLDDFDGESSDDIDKFDVRRKDRFDEKLYFSVKKEFGFTQVGQDNLENDLQDSNLQLDEGYNGGDNVLSNTDSNDDAIGGDDYTTHTSTATNSNTLKLQRLDFRNALLSDVIRVLSEESGINFVMPPEIGAKRIEVHLKDVSFEEALQAILEANALGATKVGENIVRIDTLKNLTIDKGEEVKTKKTIALLAPTKVLAHSLSFILAKNAKAMLEPLLKSIAKEDKRVTLTIEERTNSIIINAQPEHLSMVEALLKRIDIETPQVRISARIIEVEKKNSDKFGVDWGYGELWGANSGLGVGNLVFPNSLGAQFSVDAGVKTTGGIKSNLKLGRLNGRDLDLFLTMEELKSTTKILQTLNTIVADNEEAIVEAGGVDYFKIIKKGEGGGEEAELQEINYTLRLKVVPHVTTNGSIQLKIEIVSDSPTATSTKDSIAAKATRTTRTSMLLRSGQTGVTAGIYNVNKKSQISGAPLLMNIPIIGAFFRSSKVEENKREVMIMITPTIINSNYFSASESAASTQNSQENSNFSNNSENINNSSNNYNTNLEQDNSTELNDPENSEQVNLSDSSQQSQQTSQGNYQSNLQQTSQGNNQSNSQQTSQGNNQSNSQQTLQGNYQSNSQKSENNTTTNAVSDVNVDDAGEDYSNSDIQQATNEQDYQPAENAEGQNATY